MKLIPRSESFGLRKLGRQRPSWVSSQGTSQSTNMGQLCDGHWGYRGKSDTGPIFKEAITWRQREL